MYFAIHQLIAMANLPMAINKSLVDFILSKYIAPEGRCTVQYRVTSDNGITSGDESAQRATSDAIGTSDPVLDGTSLIRGDVLVIH